MHTIEIKPSEKKDKKYKAVIDGTKNVHFGQAGASDMTQHKKEVRKHAYIQRHKKNENWTAAGFNTAGLLSKHFLWNKKTLAASVMDVNEKFKNLNVKMKI